MSEASIAMQNGIPSGTKWRKVNVTLFAFRKQKELIFYNMFLRNIYPPQFDEYKFLPSVGASGGILVAWKNSVFTGNLIFSNTFAISVEFTSLHNNESWVLTSVYDPCTPAGKREFLDWFENISMPDDTD